MRPVSNPPNPWLSQHVDWLDEPPPTQLQIFEEQARSVLSKNDSPDVPFRFSVNPYRGCQHACAYCYARPGHQYLGFGAGTDFDTKIVVKKNAPDILRRELRRSQGEWVAFSGVTDCYQPVEASYGLTRACLEVCLEERTPVGIITKSALVRRDLDLLEALAEQVGVQVFLSIPFAREDTARALEPWASSPAVRFETLRLLSARGIPTGVAIAPLVPGLAEPEIPEILERAYAAGARSAFMILLRLHAEVREVFAQRLQQALPLRAQHVLSALEDMRREQGDQRSQYGQRMGGKGPRWEAVRALFDMQLRRLGYPLDAGGRIPQARRPRPSVQGELFPRSEGDERGVP